jgi:SOS-response transcriptional repressor LexA
MERKIQIASRLKQARLEIGLSQKELGKLFGVSDVTIGEIERGISNIAIPDLERLAIILGKPLDWFLADEVKLPERPPEAALSELEVSIKAYIPVVDEVSAGSGIVPIDYIAITRSRPAPESLIALRTRGLSMEPIINEKDTVIVDRAREPADGNLVVVIIDGQASVKRYRENGQGERWLENKYGSYRPEDVYMVGVVVDLIKPMV